MKKLMMHTIAVLHSTPRSSSKLRQRVEMSAQIATRPWKALANNAGGLSLFERIYNP